MNGTRTVWSATPTPFRPDGRLDERGVERLVEQHVGLEVTGLLLGGTCGEGPFMPARQRAELAGRVKRLAGDRLHVAVQVSDTSAARVRENMQAAADRDVDSVVIAPPLLRAFCNRGFLRRYFRESIAGSPLPVGLYVRPPGENPDLDLDVWREALAEPSVRFLKDSSGSAEYARAFAGIRARRSDLVLLTGYEFDVTSAVAAGYDGCLLGTGILNGGMIRRALECLDRQDAGAAGRWQQRSNALLHDLFRTDLSSWLAGLKYALVRLGLFSSPFSHLELPLDDEDRRRIDRALDRERAVILPARGP
jgi:dihydrodipicolinate synthase/N-acetylneuraminate lyase